MTRSLLAAALLLAAPFAAAQTAPADPWPLVPGNTWTYHVTSSYFQSGGGGSNSPLQAVTWTVLDSVDTASGRLPRVQFPDGDCLVRTVQTADTTTFQLLAVSGTASCTQILGPGLAGSFSVSPAASNPTVFTIGGETVTALEARAGWYDDGVSSFSRLTADGIGVVNASGSFHVPTSGSYSSEGLALRHATLAGRTVGQTLETRADFWPFAVGNRWEFRVTRDNESIGEVAWTVEAAGTGLALRMHHVRDGNVVASATCPVSLGAASLETAWQTRFSLGDCALSDPALAPNLNGTATTLGIDVYAPSQSLVIGAQGISADVATGRSQIGGGPNGPVAETYAEFARGIGPTSYYANNRIAPVTPYSVRAVLAYARVGSTTFGQQVVADEAGPDAAVLALRAGPNPTRGAVALSFTLPASADVTVEAVDALGRVVLQQSLGAQPAGAGTARVDLSGLATGVYSVRLAAGDARTAVRVSVVR